MAAFRRGLGIAAIRLAFIPMERKQLDKDQLHEPLTRDPNSGVDRVLKIFDRDENGTISPEASLINVAGFMGAVVGAISGGLRYSHIANMNFKETNEVTLFYSQREASSKMLDKMTLSFGRGAAIGGARYFIFCFSFVGISTIISRFRDKLSVLEYSIGGLIAGSLYKFGLGPKGMLSGGFFGCLLGTFMGITVVAAAELTGCSMQDVYNATHSYFQMKDKFFHGAWKKQAEEHDIILTTYYPDGRDSMSHTLDILEDLKDENELKFNKKNIVKLKTANSANPVNVDKISVANK